jgi:hypothetical protein
MKKKQKKEKGKEVYLADQSSPGGAQGAAQHHPHGTKSAQPT